MPCSSTVRFARHRTDPSGSDFMEERAQRKNHGDDGCRCEGSRNDADRSAGMIGNYAIRDRRQSPGADDAGIEQRESAADLAFARQLWNTPVEDRGRAVENDAKSGRRMRTGPSGNINVATMNKAVAASVMITLQTTPRR